MSSNIGGTNGNPMQPIKNLNLTNLDELVGKSVKGSVWAKYDLVENGGNGNEVFDLLEIFAIKRDLSKTFNVPAEVSADFEEEISKSEPEKPQSNQPAKEPPPPTQPSKNRTKTKTQYPKALLDRAAQIKKDGGAYNLVKNDDETFSIVQTSGGSYMSKNKIANIELQYDKSGKMICQRNTYTSGEIQKGVYQNGKMNWTKVAVPVKSGNKTISVPVSTKTRADAMVKAGDKCKIVPQKDGSFVILQTAGSYMTQNGISKTEILYDRDGNLIGQNNYFKNGNKKVGVMKNGKMSWTTVAAPAPEQPKAAAPKIPAAVSAKLTELKNTDATMVKSQANGSYTITQTNGTPAGIKSITYHYNSNGDFQYQLNACAIDKSVMIGRMKNGKMEFTQFKNANGFLQQIPDNVNNKLDEMRQDGGQAKILKGYETFTIVQTSGTYLKTNKLSKIEHKYNPFGVLLEQVLTYENGRVEKYYDAGQKGNDAAHIPNPIKIKLPAQYLGTDSGNEQMIYGLDTNGPKDTAQRFSKALADNKANLMASLRLTNEEYDNLAVLAMGIAEQETHFGQEKYLDTSGGEHSQSGYTDRAYVKKKANQYYWSEDEQKKHSQGITQINYSNAISNEAIKRDFEKNGIKSFKDLLSSPEKQAVATMILLKYNKNTAESATWQARLKKNNAKITDPNKRLTTNDVIALLWNGAGGVVKRMNAGETITIDSERKDDLNGAFYAKAVRTYADRFFADPTTQKSGAQHTTRTDNLAGALGATKQSNLGFIGEVVFMSKTASPATAKQFISENTQLSENNKQLLLSYITDGLVAFGGKGGLTKDEAMSITDQDVSLMTEQIEAIKTGKSTALQAGRNFEVNYLRSREFTVSNASINSANKLSSIRSASPRDSKLLPKLTFEIYNSFYRGKARHTARYSSPDTNFFAVTRSQGVNPFLANGQTVPDTYRIAAEHAEYTATELFESGGNCKTGVCVDIEYSMGIDHRKIRGVGGASIPSAKNLTQFYDAHPEVFNAIKYVDNGNGTSRELNAADVDNLPCGYFCVFTPGEGFEIQHGHAFISDGFGGGFADEHDNGKWAHFRNGKGEHGKLDVYGLTNKVVAVYSEKLGRTVNVPLSINPWYLTPEFRKLQEQECQKRGLKVPEYKEEFPV